VTAPIPERNPAGRTCAGTAVTLAAVATMLAALTRRNAR